MSILRDSLGGGVFLTLDTIDVLFNHILFDCGEAIPEITGLETFSLEAIFEALVGEGLSVFDVCLVDAVEDQVFISIVAGSDFGVVLVHDSEGFNADSESPLAPIESFVALIADTAVRVIGGSDVSGARRRGWDFLAEGEMRESIAHWVAARGVEASDITDVDTHIRVSLTGGFFFALFQVSFVFLDVTPGDFSAPDEILVFWELAEPETALGWAGFLESCGCESILFDGTQRDGAGASFVASSTDGAFEIAVYSLIEIADISWAGRRLLGGFTVLSLGADSSREFWALGAVELVSPVLHSHDVFHDFGDIHDLFFTGGLHDLEQVDVSDDGWGSGHG